MDIGESNMTGLQASQTATYRVEALKPPTIDELLDALPGFKMESFVPDDPENEGMEAQQTFNAALLKQSRQLVLRGIFRPFIMVLATGDSTSLPSQLDSCEKVLQGVLGRADLQIPEDLKTELTARFLNVVKTEDANKGGGENEGGDDGGGGGANENEAAGVIDAGAAGVIDTVTVDAAVHPRTTDWISLATEISMIETHPLLNLKQTVVSSFSEAQRAQLTATGFTE